MDVTRKRISRILEIREILLSVQTGFSLVNAAVVCAILESISGQVFEACDCLKPFLWCATGFCVGPNSLHHHHHHQSLNREGRWGTTDDFATSFLHFSLFSTALGLAKHQACPFPDVVFPPLPLSASSSSPFHCALQDGFGQT